MRPVNRGPRAQRYTVFAGAGCVVQGVGLLLLFLFPIGTVLGVILLIWGSQLSVKWRCSECKNPLHDKEVRLCPACRTELQR